MNSLTAIYAANSDSVIYCNHFHSKWLPRPQKLPLREGILLNSYTSIIPNQCGGFHHRRGEGVKMSGHDYPQASSYEHKNSQCRSGVMSWCCHRVGSVVRLADTHTAHG